MSFWQTYYHLVWATKNREPLLTSDVEPVIHNYIITKAREEGIRVYAVDGWTDHVHIAAAIPPKQSIADAVKMLKGWSSYMFNRNFAAPYFAWQSGYGVLTIGPKQLSAAIEYIQKQKEHHRAGSTNAWLERTEDEIPAEAERDSSGHIAHIKESGCEYHIIRPSEEHPDIPDWPNWPATPFDDILVALTDHQP